jgi:head-tail adaptor
MNPGALNKLIAVQVRGVSQDSVGQPIEFWTTTYQCFASIDIQGGALLYSPTEFIENVLYRITVRYDPAFTILPDMRVRWTDRWKDICHCYVVRAVWNDRSDYRQVTFLAHEIDGDA